MRETLYSTHIANGFRKSKIRKAKRFPFPLFFARQQQRRSRKARLSHNSYDTMEALMRFYASTLDGNISRGLFQFFLLFLPKRRKGIFTKAFCGNILILEGLVAYVSAGPRRETSPFSDAQQDGLRF